MLFMGSLFAYDVIYFGAGTMNKKNKKKQKG